ncbi:MULTISPECIES: CHAT domain-containing protein [Pseudanabaena]|jgi:CHAT domain-containing protein|uniref:CHAT domain-containing protein n=1 Tax=Pseudanabaena TaxID=1152 RepID=UPI0024792DD8|nr:MULTISPECIES: CHAT domain-containing protein [Pseudanabaena]MEA5486169.1 CHAT domain-containing protein [Pseudanabaena sp. CCNP1317]WGS74395.1 CHAT domain-containing protein [Pseudanabaena galeata CCNP1313]
MRYFLLWFLSLTFAMLSLNAPKSARSQTSDLTPQFNNSQFNNSQFNNSQFNNDNDSRNPNDSRTPSSNGLNPFIILNLINSLTRSGNSDQQQVDLSPDIAEIRGQIGRLYFLLARQYAFQNQLPEACNALEKGYSAELEAYLRKRLRSLHTDSNDCYASEVERISKLTGSPTALIYVTTSRGGLELIGVPPSTPNKPAGIFSRTRIGAKSLDEKMGIPISQNNQNSGKPFRKVAYNTTTEEVDRVIIDFRNNLRDTSSEDFLTQSQQLYDWVVRPMESELEKAQVKTLVFVMNGNLRVVPPAAFHDGKRYLIEKYAVTTIPSWQLTEPNRPDRSQTPQILAMGLSESIEGLSPLPAAKIEVETISSRVLVGKNFMNSAFTKDNLRSQTSSQNFGIIHLATHAKFVKQSQEESFIQFWGDRLQMNQISKMNLVTDLLTLSACETAVGQNLGLAGLAVDSGAKSVLASLWTVSDAGTAPLMIRFYRGLPTAPSKAIALQEAQLAFLRGEVTIKNNQILGIKGFPNIPFQVDTRGVDLKHPYYWSSFALIGNWL